MRVDEFDLVSDLGAEADAPSRSTGLSALRAAAKDGDKPDAAVHNGALSSQLRAAERSENAPERVDSVPLTLVAAGEVETEQLERLRDRLIAEHVRSTDELVAYRRQFAELAEEQARVQRSITALEARLEDEELMLLLIAAKLKDLAQPPS